MFWKVPIVNGELDIDYEFMREGRNITDFEAVVLMRDDAPARESWQALTELEYLLIFRAGVVTVDKSIIAADGLDAATVTAEVHPDLTEITFHHADTGEAITTVPVDPATHTTTLQVTATTPGVIRIRAGEPTVTRLNEVVINAT